MLITKKMKRWKEIQQNLRPCATIYNSKTGKTKDIFWGDKYTHGHEVEEIVFNEWADMQDKQNDPGRR